MQLTVSLIIPCRNEEKYIKKCILSILNSNYPKEFLSIYVCDGMSDDNTRNVIKSLSNKHSNIFLIDNVKKTTPFALNLGLKKSTADIKIILGAHAEIDSNFIQENVNAFTHSNKIGCTGGVIENVYENKIAEIIGLAMSSSFGVGNAHFRTGEKDGYVDTVAFGAYKKEVFENIDYFDEELARNQDDEFNFRMLKNGYKIYLSKKIKSKYYVRASYTKLYKQYFQYGYWKVFVNTKHNTITTVRQMVPLFFVLYLFVGPFTVLINKSLFYLWIVGCNLYFITAIYSAFRITTQFPKFLKITFTFFILHFSYGLGYLKGILDFVLLQKRPSKQSEKLTR